jgi:hypothetical protein
MSQVGSFFTFVLIKYNPLTPNTGDITTDLFLAGHIPDPNSEMNFITYGSMWAKHVWTYNTSFSLSAQEISSLEASTGGVDALLVFDGIKMAANIYINNKLIDTSISQFLRLNYSLRVFQQQTKVFFNSEKQFYVLKVFIIKALIAGENEISVVFDPSLETHGLFAQCSGGWDWAPYTGLSTVDNYAMYSIGIPFSIIHPPHSIPSSPFHPILSILSHPLHSIPSSPFHPHPPIPSSHVFTMSIRNLEGCVFGVDTLGRIGGHSGTHILYWSLCYQSTNTRY